MSPGSIGPNGPNGFVPEVQKSQKFQTATRTEANRLSGPDTPVLIFGKLPWACSVIFGRGNVVLRVQKRSSAWGCQSTSFGAVRDSARIEPGRPVHRIPSVFCGPWTCGQRSNAQNVALGPEFPGNRGSAAVLQNRTKRPWQASGNLPGPGVHSDCRKSSGLRCDALPDLRVCVNQGNPSAPGPDGPNLGKFPAVVADQ